MAANIHTIYLDKIKEKKGRRTQVKIKIKYTDHQRGKILKMP